MAANRPSLSQRFGSLNKNLHDSAESNRDMVYKMQQQISSLVKNRQESVLQKDSVARKLSELESRTGDRIESQDQFRYLQIKVDNSKNELNGDMREKERLTIDNRISTYQNTMQKKDTNPSHLQSVHGQESQNELLGKVAKERIRRNSQGENSLKYTSPLDLCQNMYSKDGKSNYGFERGHQNNHFKNGPRNFAKKDVKSDYKHVSNFPPHKDWKKSQNVQHQTDFGMQNTKELFHKQNLNSDQHRRDSRDPRTTSYAFNQSGNAESSTCNLNPVLPSLINQETVPNLHKAGWRTSLQPSSNILHVSPLLADRKQGTVENLGWKEQVPNADIEMRPHDNHTPNLLGNHHNENQGQSQRYDGGSYSRSTSPRAQDRGHSFTATSPRGRGGGHHASSPRGGGRGQHFTSTRGNASPRSTGKGHYSGPQGPGRGYKSSPHGVGRGYNTSPKGACRGYNKSPCGDGRGFNTSPQGIGRGFNTNHQGVGRGYNKSPYDTSSQDGFGGHSSPSPRNRGTEDEHTNPADYRLGDKDGNFSLYHKGDERGTGYHANALNSMCEHNNGNINAPRLAQTLSSEPKSLFRPHVDNANVGERLHENKEHNPMLSIFPNFEEIDSNLREPGYFLKKRGSADFPLSPVPAKKPLLSSHALSTNMSTSNVGVETTNENNMIKTCYHSKDVNTVKPVGFYRELNKADETERQEGTEKDALIDTLFSQCQALVSKEDDKKMLENIFDILKTETVNTNKEIPVKTQKKELAEKSNAPVVKSKVTKSRSFDSLSQQEGNMSPMSTSSSDLYARPNSSMKFEGRTLLKGKEVRPRHVPKNIAKGETKIPTDPRQKPSKIQRSILDLPMPPFFIEFVATEKFGKKTKIVPPSCRPLTTANVEMANLDAKKLDGERSSINPGAKIGVIHPSKEEPSKESLEGQGDNLESVDMEIDDDENAKENSADPVACMHVEPSGAKDNSQKDIVKSVSLNPQVVNVIDAFLKSLKEEEREAITTSLSGGTSAPTPTKDEPVVFDLDTKVQPIIPQPDFENSNKDKSLIPIVDHFSEDDPRPHHRHDDDNRIRREESSSVLKNECDRFIAEARRISNLRRNLSVGHPSRSRSRSRDRYERGRHRSSEEHYSKRHHTPRGYIDIVEQKKYPRSPRKSRRDFYIGNRSDSSSRSSSRNRDDWSEKEVIVMEKSKSKAHHGENIVSVERRHITKRRGSDVENTYRIDHPDMSPGNSHYRRRRDEDNCFALPSLRNVENLTDDLYDRHSEERHYGRESRRRSPKLSDLCREVELYCGSPNRKSRSFFSRR